ncbi:MAG: hypothetical protein ABIU77_06820 [Ferruginibacter sp.]
MKKLFFAATVLFLSSCSKGLLGDFSMHLDNWGGFQFPVMNDSSTYIKANIFAGNGIVSPVNYVGINTRLMRTVSAIHPDSSLVIFSAGDSTVGLEFSLVNITRPGTYRFGDVPADSTSIRAKCIFNGIDYLSDSTLMSGSIIIDTLTSNRIHAIFNVPCVHGGYTVDVKNGSFAAGF